MSHNHAWSFRAASLIHLTQKIDKGKTEVEMALPLTELETILKKIAPLHHAEPWDNVGLLIDPRKASASGIVEYSVQRVLLTIDATPEVFAELQGVNNALLVAYHPPLFHAIKRVSAQSDELLVAAIQSGVPVYSPHTALDCVPGGVNDWLAQAVGEGDVQAVQAHRLMPDDSEESPLAGVGRRITLAQPVALSELISRVKKHLGVGHLRLATALRHQSRLAEIRTVVVAAGSGSSIFNSGPVADLYLTGECGHHMVLSCLRKGASVLLAEHTTTERGYLSVLRERLLELTAGQAQVSLAQSDREPLQPV